MKMVSAVASIAQTLSCNRQDRLEDHLPRENEIEAPVNYAGRHAGRFSLQFYRKMIVL